MESLLLRCPLLVKQHICCLLQDPADLLALCEAEEISVSFQQQPFKFVDGFEDASNMFSQEAWRVTSKRRWDRWPRHLCFDPEKKPSRERKCNWKEVAVRRLHLHNEVAEAVHKEDVKKLTVLTESREVGISTFLAEDLRWIIDVAPSHKHTYMTL